MNLKAAVERHPEFALHGLVFLGVAGIFAVDFSVCLPSTSAAEAAADRVSSEVRALTGRSGLPDLRHEDYAGTVRSQVGAVSAAREMSDWTGYYKTEIEKWYIGGRIGSDDSGASREKPMPVVTLTAKAEPEWVDLAWGFGAQGGPYNAKTMTMTLLRTLIQASDGSRPDGVKEETLAAVGPADPSKVRDAAIEAGCRYSYRMRIVETRPNKAPREAGSWPTEVSIVVPVRFVLSGVANGVAVIRVEKNFGGELGWRKDTFCVRPGEPVGAPQTSMILGAHGNLDFTTDFRLREIRTDEGARQAHGSAEVKLSATVAELVSKRYGPISLVLEK